MYLIPIAEKGEYSILNNNDWLLQRDSFRQNRESIKDFLDSKAKFINIYEKNPNTDNEIKVGFRHTTSFLFQSQSIIANGNVIFYNSDDFTHLEGLRKLFPLALGYKSYKMISLEDEIKEIKKDITVLEGKIDDLQKRYDNWVNELFEFYTEAINLSLTNRDLDISLSNTDEIKDVLESVIKDVNDNILYKSGSAEKYNDKLKELENKRQQLLRELQTKKVSYNKIVKYETLKEEYNDNIYKEVSKRLSPINWFLEQKGDNLCPFCESETDKAFKQLQTLKELNAQNSKNLNNHELNELTFEKEKKSLISEIRDIEKNIKIFDRNLDNLISEMNSNHFEYQKIYQFTGKVSNFLKNLHLPDTEYFEKLLVLKNTLSSKERDLKRETKKYNKENTLTKVSNSIDKYIKLLPIENNSNSRVLIDPDKYLGIKIEDKINGKSSFLNKIGSGSNYMCYHLATMLGLHDYFNKLALESKTNYIPSFLVLDQPSQVYYPDKIEEINNLELKEKNKTLNNDESEDIQNTKKIFEVCSTFINNTSGEVQIIILEHAGESNWAGLENVHLVDKWRGSDKDGIYSKDFKALIPKNWLE